MKSKNVFLLIVALSFVSLAHAESSSSSSGLLRGKRLEARVNYLEKRKEQFEDRQERLASKAAEMQDRIEAKREEFEDKLKEVKDERKKKVTERVASNTAVLNKKQTDRFTKILTQLNTVVGKLEDKVASASAGGKDTASASAALTTAKASIDVAQTAVAEQAAKDYTPVITDTTTLGQVVSQMVTTFHADLKGVHAKVVQAKQDVKKAAVAVYNLK